MASFDYTFTSGDTVTPTKLNNARNVKDIVNADIKSDAAIAGTKIAPNFGSQNVVTTGGVTAASCTVSASGAIYNINNTAQSQSWQVGSSGSSAFIINDFTNTKIPFSIVANAPTNAFRIDASGNVGIGTSSPGAKCDLRDGTLRLSTDNSRTTVYGINRGDTGSTNGMCSIGMFGSGANGYLGNITFNTAASDVFNAALSERMRIDASGNVGIGTSSPTRPLEIVKNNGASIALVDTSTGGNTLVLEPARNSNGFAQIDVSGANALRLNTNASERMRITSGGNVGIGKNNPATILDVNGTVTATAFAGPLTGNVTGTASAIADGSVSTSAKIADGVVTPAKLSQPYTLATAQNSTSGTSIDFTGIPSWARRITVMFSEVSTNGTNDVLVQLGDAGGIETADYVSTSNTVNQVGGTAGLNRTDGFAVYYTQASHLLTGHMHLTRISGNMWVSSHTGKLTTASVISGAGSKTLSDTLTQIRITTVGGTNTFDAGAINIAYE